MSHCKEKDVSNIEPFHAPHLLAQDEGCNECFENIMDCSCGNINSDRHIQESYCFCNTDAAALMNRINETNETNAAIGELASTNNNVDKGKDISLIEF